MLDAAIQAEILRLHFAEALSFRKIARQLGVDRKSVAQVVNRRRVITSVAHKNPRASILVPYYGQIEKLLQEAPERSCVNMLQRLRKEGYQGGITILRDYVRTLRPAPQKEAFFKLDFAPGEAAQVDWGEFGDVFGNGTKVHAFVMVLCFSRMYYLEFTLRETLPTLLRCHERALHFFEGLCREHWYDNPPTIVAERVGHLVRFNPKFLAYSGFHGFKPIVCNLGAGHEKGRVEDGVKLVRYQFWPGRRFRDIDDINIQAREWLDTFANRREHRSTRKVPELVWDKERSVLIPLRADPYDTDDLISWPVSKFFRVRFEGNTYSVPWTLTGKTVTVRADDKEVRIFYGPRLVARHTRCYLKGEDIENQKHKEGLKERKPGASRNWQIELVRSLGPHASRYLDLIGAGSRSLRSELGELCCLITVYGAPQVEQTIEELLGHGTVGVSHIERALRLKQQAPPAPPPMQLRNERLAFVPPNPDLHSYDAMLLDARRDKQGDDEQ